MNSTTPRLRAHLLAELRDLPDLTASTDQLAEQVPDPYFFDHYPGDRGAPGSYVYPHLVSLERKGLVRKVKPFGSRAVHWQLVTS